MNQRSEVDIASFDDLVSLTVNCTVNVLSFLKRQILLYNHAKNVNIMLPYC